MQTSQAPLTKSTENLIRAAREAGVPRDQLDRFLRHSYVPLPWALRFHSACREADKIGGPVDIGAGGARGPGKSHAIFSQLSIDDCARVPNLKGLFLRQTGKSADESFQDLIENILVGKVRHQFTPSKGILRFPNNSKVILGGFENDKDIDKYVGIQYDVIAIEERNQLTGDKVMKLKGSLRTTKPNWRARMYSSFNPGNIGHNDVKKTFVEPYQQKNETKTRFFPSTYKDNPFLKPEYIDYLNSLPGALGKAWREGNFDTFEGQYFAEWDHEKHVIAPFVIPPTYKRFRAYDHGRDAPACCSWYALDYDGRLFKYREYYERGKDVDQIAQDILKLSGDEQYQFSVADPSIFHKTGMVDRFGGQTIAETFARNGVLFIPASNRRVDGWNLMHQYLRWDNNRKPLLQYFETCYNSIRTIPSLIHDKHNGEDLDTDGEDHAADTDRYILLSIHEGKTPAPLRPEEKNFRLMQQRDNAQLNPNDFYYNK